jgi:phosphatidylglycerophosphate synthase
MQNKEGMKTIETWQFVNAIFAISGCIVLLSTSLNIILSLLWLIHIITFAIIFKSHWSTQIAKILPNAVTFVRLGIILLVFSRFGEIDRIGVAILAWMAALGDILDGFIAKKLKGQTYFGAVFDEETDAIYILLISILIFQTGILPWWILLTGIPRYLVLLLRLNYQAKRLPSIKVPGARLIAGTAFTLFPLIFIMPEPKLIPWIGIFLTIALLYSFIFESYLYVKNQYSLYHF